MPHLSEAGKFLLINLSNSSKITLLVVLLTSSYSRQFCVFFILKYDTAELALLMLNKWKLFIVIVLQICLKKMTGSVEI